MSERTEEPKLEALPIGTPVLAFPGSREGRAIVTTTRSEPWLLPSGEPVVMVEGYVGGIAVSHIEVMPAARREADAETIRGLRERYERLRADVEEFAESLVEQGDEHVQGCMGQADCAACVRHDLRAILAKSMNIIEEVEPNG